MNITSQTTQPASTLDLRAAEQRLRLHGRVVELRSRIHERFDLKHTVREYVVPASGVAALLAFLLGYGITGIFTRR